MFITAAGFDYLGQRTKNRTLAAAAYFNLLLAAISMVPVVATGLVVTSRDKTFKSKVLRTDDKFSFMFDEPGTYEYYCSIHPKMRGKVIVQ